MGGIMLSGGGGFNWYQTRVTSFGAERRRRGGQRELR